MRISFADTELHYIMVRRNKYIEDEYNNYIKTNIKKGKRNRIAEWIFLIRLNLAYFILNRKYVSDKSDSKENEEIKAPVQFKGRLPYLEGAESEAFKRGDINDFVKELIQFDVISFDIFDTLILRPFSKPSDLFMLIGSKLNKMEFCKIRSDAEKLAREKANLEKGNREVTIYDIYKIIEERTGIPAKKGVQTEFEVELTYCFANPYMKRVFRLLKEQGKKIIIVSDMYFPREMMEKLLANVGYVGYDNLYVSCDYSCSKSTESLYKYVKRDYTGKKIVHIGDNYHSDIRCAEKAEIETRYYKNVHEIGEPYRADGMSELIGSAYAGVVNTYLHNGIKKYSPYYEYGFIYGGFYIFGFCNWMYQKAKKERMDKIIFLSRDGAIYQKIFNMFFNDVPNEYFLWSRIANTKYTLLKNRDDFLKRLVFYRAMSPVPSSIASLFNALSLKELEKFLPDYNLSLDTLIVREIINPLERLFIEHWDIVCSAYEKEKKELYQYILHKIGNAKKVAIVDVGWLGSGPMGLKYLIEDEFKINCNISCWQAAVRPPIHTDNLVNLLDQTIEPYMFSRMYNRNNFDTHANTNRGLNNVFFEMFTQDTTPSYSGIDQNYNFIFDIPEVESYEYIHEIQEGITDFCKEYHSRFKEDPILFNISGYDAYLPYRMIIRDLKFFKKYFSHITFARTVAGDSEKQSLETIDELLKQAGY